MVESGMHTGLFLPAPGHAGVQSLGHTSQDTSGSHLHLSALMSAVGVTLHSQSLGRLAAVGGLSIKASGSEFMV